jgi:hypothetical protein
LVFIRNPHNPVKDYDCPIGILSIAIKSLLEQLGILSGPVGIKRIEMADDAFFDLFRNRGLMESLVELRIYPNRYINGLILDFVCLLCILSECYGFRLGMHDSCLLRL